MLIPSGRFFVQRLGFFATLGMLAVVNDKALRMMNHRIRPEWRHDSLTKKKRRLCNFSIVKESRSKKNILKEKIDLRPQDKNNQWPEILTLILID